MNILFICDEYPPGRSGGIGISVQTLSRELVKQGHQVTVAGLYPYNYGQKDYEEDHGVKVWRLRYGRAFRFSFDSVFQRFINRLPNRFRRMLYGTKAFQDFLNFIEKLILSEKIEIIEAPDFNNFSMVMGLKTVWPSFKVPFVVKSHGSYTYFQHELGLKPKNEYKETDALLFKRADALSAVSRYAAEVNRSIFGPQEFEILYNGINLPTPVTMNRRDDKTVIFTGTLVQKKGIYSLIKAWNMVIEKHKNARLIIFGKGNTRKLLKLVEREAFSSIQFNGHVDRNIVLDQLSKAALGVFPSYSETFGLAAVETMATGCPVIFSKRSCGPEIVEEGVDGLLVDPDNIDEIAAKIILLLEDEDKRKRFSENGVKKVKEKFEISVLTRKHIAFYNKVINNFVPKNN